MPPPKPLMPPPPRFAKSALDPSIEVDTAKVGAAVVAAELTRDRLKAALPRLRARYTEARQREDETKWNAEAVELRVRRDAMVKEFATLWPVELIKNC